MMNKLSLIPFSLLLFFTTNNNLAMDLVPQSINNLTSTTEESLLKTLVTQRSLMNTNDTTSAVAAIIVEMDNINSLKRTHVNAFNSNITKEAKKQCLENKNLISNRKKTFICTECNKAFIQKGDLTRHLRTHTNERPFSCTFNGCNKAFTQKTDLTIHIRTHTNERPYTCTFNGCNKAFTVKGNLNRHLITHTNKLNPQNIKY